MMRAKNSMKFLINELRKILFSFDLKSVPQKKRLLEGLSKSKFNQNLVLEYHECLLFMIAYPDDNQIFKLAQKELQRIASYLKKLNEPERSKFNDSGLPYTNMITRFTCDALVEMINEYKCNIEIDSFEEMGSDLNSLLNLTLTSVLKQETTAGLSNLELMNHLGVKPGKRINFLLEEFNKLDATPLIKDHLWESLKMFVTINSDSKNYSRSFNVIKTEGIYFQNELLKKFDFQSLMNTPLPLPLELNNNTRKEVVGVVKKSMLLNMRETDTSTYMNISSLELYQLERGISIAIYDLSAVRQLPYQSYIGYTAFKNGLPVAYGGSWIFGETAMFGLNILESFRGGESGYIMCQLLRTYLQRFQLSYIEVENYQFGKDNPDGIKSGAFWFYYRYGFRPVDKKLNAMAKAEFQKISSIKAYRTTEKTLKQLCESNLALNFGSQIPYKKEEVFSKVIKMMKEDFKGNINDAVMVSKEEFLNKIGHDLNLKQHENTVFEEIALWAKAFRIDDAKRLLILKQMISTKGKDAFAYQQLVRGLLRIT